MQNPFQRSVGESTQREQFRQPLWWTKAFGWTSFISRTSPSYHPPFDVISIPRPTRAASGQFGMPLPIAGSWNKLERDIKDAVVYLTAEFSIPAVCPYMPFALGYSRSYSTLGDAFRSARLAGDWFVIWQGLLSYVIARTFDKARGKKKEDGYQQSPPLPYPSWFSSLERKGYSQHWLEGIHQSTIALLNNDIPRAGVFFDPADGDTSRPSIEWFLDHSIPVWYKWSPAAAKIVDPKYHPPPSMLREWTRYASPVLMAGAPFSCPLYAVADPVTIYSRREQIKGFIADRTAAFEDAKRAGPADALKHWARRSEKPPTAHCRVFVWDAKPSDPMILERRRAWEFSPDNMLANFSAGQRWYDVLENEWHCCRELAWDEATAEGKGGEGSLGVASSSLIQADRPPEGPFPMSKPCSASSGDGCVAFVPSESIPPASRDLTATEDHPLETLLRTKCDVQSATRSRQDDLLNKILDHLTYRLGFAPPVPFPCGELKEPIPQNQVEMLLRIAGFDPALSLDPELRLGWASLCKHAFDFVQSMLQGGVSNHLWDLSTEHVVGWQRNAYLYRFIVVQPSSHNGPLLYCFDLPGRPWLVAVTSATDALAVCRWVNANRGVRDIVMELVHTSVRFYTMAPACGFARTPSHQRVPRTSIPIRLAGYTFTKSDYDAYIRSRSLLLCQPRMRAALMRGGIVWRLAIATMSATDVLAGPSDAPSISMVHTRNSEQYVDDDLTSTELQLICGAYLCYTGHGEQVAIKSWWPLHDLFEGEDCGENYGRWNQFRENHYQRRQTQILQDGAQPLGWKDWRQRMHGTNALRLLKKKVEMGARLFLARQAPSCGLRELE